MLNKGNFVYRIKEDLPRNPSPPKFGGFKKIYQHFKGLAQSPSLNPNRALMQMNQIYSSSKTGLQN